MFHHSTAIRVTHLAVLDNAGHIMLDGRRDAKVNQLHRAIHQQEVRRLKVRVDDAWQMMMNGLSEKMGYV